MNKKSTIKPVKKKGAEEIEELTSSLQRLQADFENYQKQVEKEKQRYAYQAVSSFVKQFLPILDAFDHALSQDMDKKTKQGLEMLHVQITSCLSQAGVREIPASGKANPEFHEVLLKEESKEEENRILEVVQKGYFLNDSIIRPAKVKVAKNAD